MKSDGSFLQVHRNWDGCIRRARCIIVRANDGDETTSTRLKVGPIGRVRESQVLVWRIKRTGDLAILFDADFRDVLNWNLESSAIRLPFERELKQIPKGLQSDGLVDDQLCRTYWQICGVRSSRFGVLDDPHF